MGGVAELMLTVLGPKRNWPARRGIRTPCWTDCFRCSRGGARLAEAIRYATLGQGKRLRPFLVVESARLFDVPRPNALRVGAALECVHCYSLVHDDLPAMDDDDMRRGKPTTHKAFDEATAILVVMLCSRLPSKSCPIEKLTTKPRCGFLWSLISRRPRVLRAWWAARCLISKQRKAVFARSRRSWTCRRRRRVRFSALPAKPAPFWGRAIACPSKSMEKIGIAFQIADDLLDVESTPAKLGKATQKDRRKGQGDFCRHAG